jgi:hypothetical protein
VKYLSGKRIQFDAGHRYTVDITWEREGSPDGDVAAWQRDGEQIDALRFELANRPLEKMLGPRHPSAFGVAAFFMDRLKINVPVTEVRVHESDSDIVAIIRDDRVY